MRALLTLALLAGLAVAAGGETTDEPVQCPLEYPRHTVAEILRGTRPWLWDGAYHNFDNTNSGGRFCTNCHRGSLFPTWCGRKHTKQAYWDLQTCESTITKMAIEEAGKHDDIRGALTMTPCDLYAQLKGRTLWIIGDSMSKDLIKAFKCFMIEFWDLNQYHITSNYTAMHHLQSMPGYGEPNCIHMPGSTRMCQIHAIQGDLFVNTSRAASGVLPLITSTPNMAEPGDIIVLNFGLWHGEVQRPRYIQHLHELGEFYKKNRETFPHIFFMETPKQHFADAADGDFKSAWLADAKRMKGNHKCGPVKGVRYEADGTLTAPEGDAVGESVVAGTWRNADARRILQGKYGMRLVPIYNTTVAFWNMHRKNFGGTECSHFCHPSIPQLWLWVLHRTLADAQIPPLPPPTKPRYRPREGCGIVYERDELQLGGAKAPERVFREAADRRRGVLRKRYGRLWWFAHLFGR